MSFKIKKFTNWKNQTFYQLTCRNEVISNHRTLAAAKKQLIKSRKINKKRGLEF